MDSKTLIIKSIPNVANINTNTNLRNTEQILLQWLEESKRNIAKNNFSK
ncbi:MAG: hypothetical protein K2Q22_08220 [Cytophagales bacterium]|nr:hypothetical protein [Cytophagales bacterium]